MTVEVVVGSGLDEIESSDSCRPGHQVGRCTLRSAISYCNEEFVRREPRQLKCEVVLNVSTVLLTRSIVIDASSNPSPMALSIVGNGAKVRCSNGFIEVHGVLTSLSMTESTVEGFAHPIQTEGSALYLYQIPTVLLIGVNFTDNDGFTGGAMFIGSSTNVHIAYCHFRNNAASSSGGALFVSKVRNVLMEKTVFDQNRMSARFGSGGAVVFDSVSSLHVSNCTFYNNTAFGSGGAMYFSYSESEHSVIRNSTAVVIIDHTTFAGNTAAVGAGVCLNATGAILHVVSTVLKNNSISIGDANNDLVHADIGSGGGMFVSGNVM